YCHRWEIELGFREIKQTMLDSAYHLRSKRPDMVRQELWAVLLVSIYNEPREHSNTLAALARYTGLI
ncbi:hypothetical protein PL71_01445, partial [Pseudoalteromonas distincta]